jgi:hypothetical protein
MGAVRLAISELRDGRFSRHFPAQLAFTGVLSE